MVFVKSELASVIRNVEGTTRKVNIALTIPIFRTHPPLPFTDRIARNVGE